MTTRKNVSDRAHCLAAEIRAQIQRGTLTVGSRVDVATVALRHGVSRPTAMAALRPLIADEILKVRPRVGVFVVRSGEPGDGVHVLLSIRRQLQTPMVNAAFCSELERLGSTGMVVTSSDLGSLGRDGAPRVLGMFIFGDELPAAALATTPSSAAIVHYGHSTQGSDRVTRLDLDHQRAGELAAREMLFSGQRNVTFVGLHNIDNPVTDWSQERSKGSATVVARHQPRQPMREIVLDQNRFQHHCSSTDWGQALRRALAVETVERLDPDSALVCADDRMITQIAHELDIRGVPSQQWPAMVGFEGLDTRAPTHLASVDPGWDVLGRRAAQLLFDAATGRRAAPALELVPPTGVMART